MNKIHLLDLLVNDATEMAEKKLVQDYQDIRELNPSMSVRELLEDCISDIYKRDTSIKANLSQSAEKLIPELREEFNDDVTSISLILGALFPDQYHFFRVSHYNSEVMSGLELFSDCRDYFESGMGNIGKRNFDRYLEFNSRLQRFAVDAWPDAKDRSRLISHFLFDSLPRLFLEKSDYNRYWVAAVVEKHMQDLKPGKTLSWSGNKEVQEGDLIFIYQARPISALTHIYEVSGDPYFDPFGGWNGFWMEIAPVSEIPNFPIQEMRTDPILGNWGTVKKNFTGTVTEPVPHRIYNAILDRLPEELKEAHGLRPEQLDEALTSGEFHSEEQFEDQVIEPLIQRWAFRFKRQHPCRVQIGRQRHVGRVDFLVSDQTGDITLFENKFRIINEIHLSEAIDQAKSYALFLGLPSFVVAAPEGIWVYSLKRNEERLEMHVEGDELGSKEDELRSKLLSLGQK